MSKQDATPSFMVGKEKRDAKGVPFACTLLRMWRGLASRNHFLGSATVYVGLVEHNAGAHMCWTWGEHLLLAVNQIAGIKGGQLKAVAMRDGIGGAGLDTIAAKNAAIVVDVIDLGVAFGAAHALFGDVIGSFDIDAIRRTIRGAQKAGYAFFQSIFVALQNVGAAEAGFNACAAERAFAIRIIFNRRGLEHLNEGDAHSFSDGGDVF